MAVNVKGFLYVIHTPFSVNLICVVVYFFYFTDTTQQKKCIDTSGKQKVH